MGLGGTARRTSSSTPRRRARRRRRALRPGRRARRRTPPGRDLVVRPPPRAGHGAAGLELAGRRCRPPAWRRRRGAVRTPPSSLIASSGFSSGLPCLPSLSSTSRAPLPFFVRATITVGRSCGLGGLGVARASIAATSWPSISIACQPYALARAGVGVEIPAVHRLARLAEPVDVDDRDEVVELVERRRARTPPRSSPRPSRSRRTGPRRGRAAGPGAVQRARLRRRSAGPGRASRWRRRPTATPASGGPRAGYRAGGRSAAPHR